MTLLNVMLMLACLTWSGWCLKTYVGDPHWSHLLAAMASFLGGIYFFLVVLGRMAVQMQSVAVTYV